LIESETYPQLTGYAGWVAGAIDRASIEIGIVGSHFAGTSGYDFAEGYVGLLAREWSARVYVSPDYYGRGVATAYVELNGHVPLDERARVFAHVGALVPLRSIDGNAGKTRADVSIGAGIVVSGWDLHLAAVGATRGGPYPAIYDRRHATVVVGASFSF
jgi:GNAT superfamily N-acetyltransferase